jgi:hypothetical protein
MSQPASAPAKKPGSFKQPTRPAPEAAVPKPASRQRRKARLLVPDATAAPVPHSKPAAKAAQADRASVSSSTSGKSATKGKKVSALDAAATVLGSLAAKDAAQGLSAGDLIAKMETAKLWTSPGGKTPSATLYAAIVREITLKGKEARFSRPGPGRFALAGAPTKKSKTPATSAKAPKAAKA